ncbi:hypothetical protein C8R44DRAFT_754191 [Mycena epipterygia]|nr:hypothetical protein C8R44DRAFT_754191 [Mycena epipterygia]
MSHVSLKTFHPSSLSPAQTSPHLFQSAYSIGIATCPAGWTSAPEQSKHRVAQLLHGILLEFFCGRLSWILSNAPWKRFVGYGRRLVVRWIDQRNGITIIVHGRRWGRNTLNTRRLGRRRVRTGNSTRGKGSILKKWYTLQPDDTDKGASSGVVILLGRSGKRSSMPSAVGGELAERWWKTNNKDDLNNEDRLPPPNICPTDTCRMRLNLDFLLPPLTDTLKQHDYTHSSGASKHCRHLPSGPLHSVSHAPLHSSSSSRFCISVRIQERWQHGNSSSTLAKTSSPEPHYHLPAFLRDPNFTVKVYFPTGLCEAARCSHVSEPLCAAGACVVCARTAVAAELRRLRVLDRRHSVPSLRASSSLRGYHLPWTVSQLVGVPPALVKSGGKPQGQRHIDGWQMVWR